MVETATRWGHTSQLKDTLYDSPLHYDLYHIVTYNRRNSVILMYLLLLYNCRRIVPHASVRVTTSYTTTQQTCNRPLHVRTYNVREHC